MPAGPMFPRPYLPRRPFGLRPPIALPPGFPGGYGRYLRLLRPAFRFIPWLGWALTAYELWQYFQQQGDDLADGGWHQCCNVPSGSTIDAYKHLTSISVGSAPYPNCQYVGLCGTSGQVPSGAWPSAIPEFVHPGTGSAYRAQALYLGFYNPAGTRMTYVEGYKRFVHITGTPDVPVEWPEIDPTDRPMPVPITLPDILPPWVDPLRPPGRPQPEPWAPPVRRPPELRPPADRPETSDRGHTDPGSPPAPEPWTRPSRPPPGTRERKVIARDRAARRFLGWLTSTASEAGDLLDSLYDALPERYQVDEERPNTQEKLAALYANWQHVDMAEAFENIWSNEVEDRYLGEFFQGVQDGMAIGGVDFGGLKLNP